MLFAVALSANTATAQICFDERYPGAPSSSRFQDNADGTISDPASGLIWKKCSEGRLYDPATGGCTGSAGEFMFVPLRDMPSESGIGFWVEGVNAGQLGENLGYTDWRAPSLYELASLADRRCADPATDAEAFPDTENGRYHARGSCGKYTQSGIDFSTGSATCVYYHTSTYLRLVRGPTDGQQHFSLTVNPGGYVVTTPAPYFSSYGPQGCSSEYPWGCSGDYFPATQISMHATANEGYRFVGWTGDCEGDTSTCEFAMGDGGAEIRATFEPGVETDAPGIHLRDARYYYGVEVPSSGTDNPLRYQGWNGACAMTMLVLRVERGRVDLYLCPDSGDTCKRYADSLDAELSLFSYSLYTGDEQGFGLVSALPESSRVSAFYYCFTLSEDETN